MDWRLGWSYDVSACLEAAQQAEWSLAYSNSDACELDRKGTGSYYTPTDTATYFWNECFSLCGCETHNDCLDVLERYHFVEPAVGAGALVFALFQKLIALGSTPQEIAQTKLTLIDINAKALAFVKAEINALEKSWGVKFDRISYICTDFLQQSSWLNEQPLFIFGNPPFVANERGSRWKNQFADFTEIALNATNDDGIVQFIVPVSIAFSRDFSDLRAQMRVSGRSVALSSFDNIPDTLFLSGKPGSRNTNKANSQRCSILTVFPDDRPRVLTTKMHRWGKADRQTLLSQRPLYFDATDYLFDNQIPRPENYETFDFINRSGSAKRLRMFWERSGPFQLNIAGVARNFIGIREDSKSASHKLYFCTEEERILVLLIVTSDLFFNYWRTIGDGFHLTLSNLAQFPVPKEVLSEVKNRTALGDRIWANRKQYKKEKAYPNGVTVSYDFSPVALSLIDLSRR